MKTALLIGLVLVLTACVTAEQVRPAIHAINAEFKREYELVLDEIGSRRYPISIEEALAALARTLDGIGMTIVSQDPMTGLLRARGPAPSPLTDEEWQKAAEIDQPVMQQIIRPYVGTIPSHFVKLEPEGLDVLIRAIVIPSGIQTEVSLTARMREVAPPPSGLPRRDYLPPTAVRMGLEKIWREFERQIEVADR